jgi:hypothetical protein
VRERRPSHSSGCCSVAAPHPLRNASRETAHLVVEAYLALKIGPEQRSRVTQIDLRTHAE